MEIFIFLILLLLVEIIGTVGGFGSSMLLVPLASFFFPFQEVLLLTATIHIASNLSKIYLFRHGFDKKLIIFIGIPSVIFVLIGAWLSQFLIDKIAQLLLGIFLTSFSLLMIWKRNLTIKPATFNTIGAGALSGFVAGLLGTGGAIRGLALSAFQLEKSIFVATSAAIDFGVDFSRFFVYLNQTGFNSKYLPYVPLLIIASFVGSYIGKLLLNKISQKLFQKIVLFLVFSIGLYTLLRALL